MGTKKKPAVNGSVFREEAEPPKKKYTHLEVRQTKEGVITLPEGMNFEDAIGWLNKMNADMKTNVQFSRVFKFHPSEGCVALNAVIRRCFGFSEQIPTPTMFGPNPPEMRSVPISPTESVSVPWGRMTLPGIQGYIETGGTQLAENAPPVFVMAGVVWKRDVPKLEFIADEVEKQVKTASIYRGKAIDSQQRFLDLGKVNKQALIFGEELSTQIAVNIWTPIAETERCVAAGIPLKRGILLEGPYGCGKTMTGYVTAQLAVEHGWTFILAKDGSNMAEVLDFAKQYEPAVIFMEDIDASTSGEERNAEINSVLNTIDGVLSKDSKIMVVVTSNHADRLNRAMLRPGRLDAILHIGLPTADAIEKMISAFSGGMMAADEDVTEVAAVCVGMIPATINEVVKRSKLYAITRTEENEEARVTAEDLLMSAKQMRRHLDLMAGPGLPKKSFKILAEVDDGKLVDHKPEMAEVGGLLDTNGRRVVIRAEKVKG